MIALGALSCFNGCELGRFHKNTVHITAQSSDSYLIVRSLTCMGKTL